MRGRVSALAVLLLGIASVVSFALAARLVPASEVMAAMASARPMPAALVLAMFGLNHGLRILRFRVLLPATVPLGRVVTACLVGFFAISTLPLRLGELVRPAALARDGVPLEDSIAAVLVERALDLLVLLGLLAWLGLVVRLPGGVVVSGVDVVTAGRRSIGVLAVVLASALVAVAAVGPHLSVRLPKGAEPLGRLGEALRTLGRDPARGAQVVLLTVATWATAIAYVGIGLAAVPGLPSGAHVATVTWTTILAATTVLPTPGFIGSFEAAAVEVLGWQGADRAAALAFAVLLHAAYLVFVAVVGVAALAADFRRRRPPRD